MPEKALPAGFAGMASITSAGSCDSVVSITSNHSALSDESYDYLSAEERDVLMYLEETIDSLDAEGDSGLSTDESERVEETRGSPRLAVPTENALPTSPYEREASKPASPGKLTVEKNATKSSTISGWAQEPGPKSGFNSLPKNLMIPRAELAKNTPVPTTTPPSPAAVTLTHPEKPKRRSLVPESEPETQILEFGLIPPPELFRDASPMTKSPPLIKNLLPVSGERTRSDRVDGTDLKGASRITLEKDQPVAALGNSQSLNEVVDTTRTALQQPGRASPGHTEPVKETEGHRHVPWQNSIPVPPAPTGNAEPLKETVVLRAPRPQIGQELPVPPGKTESAKEPLSLKPSPGPNQPPPSQHPNPEVSQTPKEQAFRRPVSPQTAGKNGERPKVGHTTSSVQQEALQHPAIKTVDQSFKHGPPTAPKPPKLPPHIVVKPSHVNHNIEPQQRYRTQSLINPSFLSRNRSSSVKSHVVKDEETSRQEALQKLNLQQGKDVSQTASLVNSSGTPVTKEIPIPQAAVEKSLKNGSADENQNYQKTVWQEKANIATSPVKIVSGLRSREIAPPQDKSSGLSTSPGKNGGGLQSREIVPPQDKSSGLSTSPGKNVGGLRSREIVPPQDKSSGLSTSPGKNGGGLRSREFGAPPKEKASAIHTSPSKSYGAPKANAIPIPQSDQENPPKNCQIDSNQSSPKSGWPDKISTFSASPERGYGLRSREFPPRQADSDPVALSNKTKGLSSSQIDLSSRRPAAQFTHSAVPGLKEANFKSCTLERSGIGLSGSIKGGEEPSQNRTSGSIFGKPISSKLTPNFLRNSRPRPASLGAGVDFKAIREAATPPAGDSEPAKTEQRRSSPFQLFSSKPRPTSLISVKITPKNSTDQHREALKKLGLLQE